MDQPILINETNRNEYIDHALLFLISRSSPLMQRIQQPFCDEINNLEDFENEEEFKAVQEMYLYAQEPRLSLIKKACSQYFTRRLEFAKKNKPDELFAEWVSQLKGYDLEALHFPKITLAQLDLVLQFKSLRTLHIPHSDITDENFEKVVASLPNLQNLNINACPKLTMACTNEIPALSHLKHLDISNNPWLTNIQFLSNMALESLSISNCRGLQSGCLQLLVNHPIIKLDISNNDWVQEKDLSDIEKQFKETLQELNLASCSHFTESICLRILTECPISRLNISGNGWVSSEQIVTILRSFPLDYLDISSCLNVSVEAIESLLQHVTEIIVISDEYHAGDQIKKDWTAEQKRKLQIKEIPKLSVRKKLQF